MPPVVLFDLDNTLIDRDAAFDQLLRATLGDDRQATSTLRRLDASGTGSRDAFMASWHAITGEVCDASRFAIRIAEHVHADADLLLALEKLSRHAVLGIITNGGSESQRAKFARAKLDSAISANRLWISAEIKIEKPDPRIFHYACDQLEVSPQDCLYIGDQPQIDIAGARAAGMQTWWAQSPLTATSLEEATGELASGTSGSGLHSSSRSPVLDRHG